jgi:large subunit ribosomal protein L16
MLLPKRTKFRKTQKGRIKGLASRGSEVSFGTYGLKSLDTHLITNRQIESARIAVTRFMKREGKVWIRIFPDKIITRKPLEVRMGKGKGNPEGWGAPVRPGVILFECDGVPRSVAEEAMRLAAQKLPVRCKFVTRRDAVEIAE